MLLPLAANQQTAGRHLHLITMKVKYMQSMHNVSSGGIAFMSVLKFCRRKAGLSHPVIKQEFAAALRVQVQHHRHTHTTSETPTPCY